MDKIPFYITTAIAYTSKKPHIGNSYEIILTDAIARFKRMQGYDVFFCTGTDEHGQKIEDSAKEAGVTPKEYVDKIAAEVKEICDSLGASYDYFIRTTDANHIKTVQKIFKKLYDQGDIYKSNYEGMYCKPCESFWTGTQLVNGKCPDCGRDVTVTKEEAYFFKMSKYQGKLEKHIEENPDFIFPESRKKEMVNNFIKPGLQDLCVSRTSFKWGIPVDFDENHVVYVWIDALSNYITALGYDPDGNHGSLYKKYWPADAHVIGKDILRFHTIYWPIMLMALGEPLPKQIFGHPWLLSGEDKMSKSRGNVIYADELAKLIGVDAVRYSLLSAMPYAQDGNVSYELIFDKYNSDLANTLGNLVNRTVAMVNKYFDGIVFPNICSDDLDLELTKLAIDTAKSVTTAIDQFKISDALEFIMVLARRSNKYIDETAPWALAKDDNCHERLATVLYNLLESIRFLAVLLTPFMPKTSFEILRQINADARSLESLESFDGTRVGTKVGEGKPLFSRLDIKALLDEIEKKFNPDHAFELADEITIGDFSKVELRVASVKSCEKIQKSDKLLCLQLDDGMGGRQVVSGIAKYYEPSDLIGKKVIIVANLKKAKLCSVESCGMILAATGTDGKISVIFPDQDLPCGAKIS